jgi:hypothetical protein
MSEVIESTQKTGVSDTSGKALVEHWKWAAEKGLMNSNTASALRAACVQVMSVLDNWETLDVRALNVDDVFSRFQNRRGRDFRPASLATYRRRFERALKLFLGYVNNPTSWRPPGRDMSAAGANTRKDKTIKLAPNGSDMTDAAAESPDSPAPPLIAEQRPNFASGLVDYPFPLREGRFAYLKLPVDLTAADVKRLTAYLNTLVIEPEPATLVGRLSSATQ